MALYRVCAILGGKLAFLRNRRVHQGSNQVVLDVANIVFRAVEVVIYRHQRIVGELFQPVLNRPCRPFPPADPNSGFRRGMQLDHDFHDFIEPFPIVFPLIFQQVVILDLPLDQIAHILEVLTGCKGFSGFKVVPAPGHVFVLVGVNRRDFVQPAYGCGIRVAACIVC